MCFRPVIEMAQTCCGFWLSVILKPLLLLKLEKANPKKFYLLIGVGQRGVGPRGADWTHRGGAHGALPGAEAGAPRRGWRRLVGELLAVVLGQVGDNLLRGRRELERLRRVLLQFLTDLKTEINQYRFDISLDKVRFRQHVRSQERYRIQRMCF